MKRWGLILAIFSLSACTAMKEGVTALKASQVTAVATNTNYTCAYHSEFDSLTDCQTATHANCQYRWESFPSGGTSMCYYPVAGWEACSTAQTNWTYTAYSVTGITPTGYQLTRSLIGCSSNICACQTTPVLTTTIASLPTGCVPGNCAPYIYNGTFTVSNVNYQLTAPTNQISSATSATITVPAAPANTTFKIYGNSSCSGSVLGTAVSGATAGSPLTIGVTGLSGGGWKYFFTKVTIGTNTTACSNTNLSFYQSIAPNLVQPSSVFVPSASYAVGSPVTLSFSNQISGNVIDNTGITFSCLYDSVVNGAISGGTSCSSLPGATFSDGTLTWTPTTVGPKEICVVGTNSLGSSTKCAAVYFVNGLTYGLSTNPALVSDASTSFTPTITVTSAPYNTTFKVFSDASCTNQLATTSIVDVMTQVSAPVSEQGLRKFFAQYSTPSGSAVSSCIDTGRSYTWVSTPLMQQPNHLIFPNDQVKGGTTVSLNFGATDSTGVTYSCKYDRWVDGTAAAGSSCSLLSGVTFTSSTGVVNWVTPTTANGPYEICVTGVQAALLADGSHPQATMCAVVDVVPALLATNQNNSTYGMIHFYDSQYAQANGGQNSIGAANTGGRDWKDLLDDNDGELKNSSNLAVTYTAGWRCSSATNASTCSVALNYLDTSVDSDYRREHIDLKTSTLTNTSITADMWATVRAKPLNGYRYSSLYSTLSETTYGYLMNYHDTVNLDRSLVLQYHDAGGGLYRFRAYIKGNDGNEADCESQETYAYGTNYHHVTYSWNQQNLSLSLYVDGVLACRNQPNSTYGQNITGTPNGQSSIPGVTRQMTLGCDTNANYRLRGDIASFKLYNSASEAAYISFANFCAERSRFGVAAGAVNCP